MDIPVINKKRIRKIKGKETPFTAIEHSYRDFQKELDPATDHLYRVLVGDSDEFGMSLHAIRTLKTRLGRSQDTIYSGLKKLAHWGLIIFESRENGYATQILQVPDYDFVKQRHITVHVHNPVELSPNEVADKLKIFDAAINDPQQAQFKNMLISQRTEFLKSLPDHTKKTTVRVKVRS